MSAALSHEEMVAVVHANMTPPDPATGCRYWHGGVSAEGYPRIMFSGRSYYVARLLRGNPRGVSVMRADPARCPKECVEPSHYVELTASEVRERAWATRRAKQSPK